MSALSEFLFGGSPYEAELKRSFPKMSADLIKQYDEMINMMGAQGDKLKKELQRRINAGQIKGREDLARFFQGALPGRLGAMMTKSSLQQQDKLSDILGGVWQQQRGLQLEKAKSLRDLEAQRRNALLQLAATKGQGGGFLGSAFRFATPLLQEGLSRSIFSGSSKLPTETLEDTEDTDEQ